MKGHLLTIVVLLLALACHVGGLTGAGMALFFVGAALEIACWLRTVQAPRRVSPRLLARIGARR
jgi:hypothetical protein